VTGYGKVVISSSGNRNRIVELKTTLTVPPEPAPFGILFLWPGLQPVPDSPTFLPIDDGVLQPVLTWGDSCAPNDQPPVYSTWWISAQYVNTVGNQPDFMGCLGGPGISVNVGDTLEIDMRLTGMVWRQNVTDLQTGESASFSKDMMGQAMNEADFVIEEDASAPVSIVVFSDTTITFASPDDADCKLTQRGQTDYVSVPEPSADGTSCYVQQMILRAEGIP
jgi:hypothetical protein